MRIFTVDAFADQPFRGNPAGVCLVDSLRPDEWLQSVAREMNLSETAFLLSEADGMQLRWFTPKREVRLCGHATLATAHILWEQALLDTGVEARFQTKSGLLTARRQGTWIAMDFPARFADPAPENLALNEALGIRPVRGYKTSSAEGDIYLLEVETQDQVRHLAPDFAALPRCGVRSVIVTCRSESLEYDFVSRYFAPGVGVNEDPVTGSAHCFLAPYWGSRLNKRTLVGLQASERAGIVRCEWSDQNATRVVLRGQAVTVFKGELQV